MPAQRGFGFFSGYPPTPAPAPQQPAQGGLLGGWLNPPNALTGLLGSYVPPTAQANVLASQQRTAPPAPQTNALTQAPQVHQNSVLDNLMMAGGVPVHARTFVQALAGRTAPITERDLTPGEQQQLDRVIAAARQNREQRFSGLSPQDIQTKIDQAKQGFWRDEFTGDHSLDKSEIPDRVAGLQYQLAQAQKVQKGRQWFDAGNGTIGDLDDYLNSGNGKALNTAMALQQTLGRATYTTTPDGTRDVRDSYDFWNEDRAPQVQRYEQMSPMQRVGSVLFDSSQDPSLASRVGNAFIGRRSIPVDIKLKPPR